MIQMPRRSVTRFFIPLIDVLLLLFCIFLLMPFNNEQELQARRESSAELGDQVTVLRNELSQRLDELQTLKSDQPKLFELDELRAEIARLQRQLKDQLRLTAVQVIDADGKTGELFFYDPALPPAKARVPIPDEKAAKELIARHRKEAGVGREIYYYFLLPRPVTGFPTLAQVRRYREWFAQAPHSLGEEPKK